MQKEIETIGARGGPGSKKKQEPIDRDRGGCRSGELSQEETAQHVRTWLRARVDRAESSGVLASRIPSLWAEDYPTAGPCH